MTSRLRLMPTMFPKTTRPIALLIAAVGAVGPALSASAASIESMIEAAQECTQRSSRYNEGIDLAEKVVADAKANAKQKAAAFDVLVTIHEKRRKYTQLIDAADRALAACPKETALCTRAALAAANAWWVRSKRTEAIAQIEKSLPVLAGDKDAAADLRLKLATYLMDTQKYDRAYEEAKAALDAAAGDVKRAADALRIMADTRWRKGDMPACQPIFERLLQPRYAEALSYNLYGIRDQYGEALQRQGKHAEAVAYYRKARTLEKDLGRSQRYTLLMGEILLARKQHDEALAALEQVFTDYDDITAYAFDAQSRIVEAQTAKGDFPAALGAARILLDAAGDSGRLAAAIQKVAAALKAVDKNLGRANRFILYQKHGPAGEDGKPGTADDLKDPLAKLAYPPCPKRRQALAKACDRARDDARAWVRRAVACTYTGRPREALAMYLDAFARSDSREFGQIGKEMILVGVRAVQGHPHGLDRFFDFVNFGPDGPDAKPKTADDLRDPFAELGFKAGDLRSSRPGGSAKPTPEDLAALRDARALLRRLAVDELERSDLRRDALAALTRVQLALNDWAGQPGPEWYRQQAAHPPNARYASTWLAAGQLAAKAGAWHLGGIRQYWRDVDAADAAGGAKQPRDVERIRKDLTRQFASLRLPRPLVSRSLKRWDVRPAKLDVSRLRTLQDDSQRR